MQHRIFKPIENYEADVCLLYWPTTSDPMSICFGFFKTHTYPLECPSTTCFDREFNIPYELLFLSKSVLREQIQCRYAFCFFADLLFWRRNLMQTWRERTGKQKSRSKTGHAGTLYSSHSSHFRWISMMVRKILLYLINTRIPIHVGKMSWDISTLFLFRDTARTYTSLHVRLSVSRIRQRLRFYHFSYSFVSLSLNHLLLPTPMYFYPICIVVRCIDKLVSRYSTYVGTIAVATWDSSHNRIDRLLTN